MFKLLLLMIFVLVVIATANEPPEPRPVPRVYLQHPLLIQILPREVTTIKGPVHNTTSNSDNMDSTTNESGPTTGMDMDSSSEEEDPMAKDDLDSSSEELEPTTEGRPSTTEEPVLRFENLNSKSGEVNYISTTPVPTYTEGWAPMTEKHDLKAEKLNSLKYGTNMKKGYRSDF